MDDVMLVLALAAGRHPDTCPKCGFMWTISEGHGECIDWTNVYLFAENFINTDLAGTSLILSPTYHRR